MKTCPTMTRDVSKWTSHGVNGVVVINSEHVSLIRSHGKEFSDSGVLSNTDGIHCNILIL